MLTRVKTQQYQKEQKPFILDTCQQIAMSTWITSLGYDYLRYIVDYTS